MPFDQSHTSRRLQGLGGTVGTYAAAINSVLGASRVKKISTAPEKTAMLKSFLLEGKKHCFSHPAWDLGRVVHLTTTPYEPLGAAIQMHVLARYMHQMLHSLMGPHGKVRLLGTSFSSINNWAMRTVMFTMSFLSMVSGKEDKDDLSAQSGL